MAESCSVSPSYYLLQPLLYIGLRVETSVPLFTVLMVDAQSLRDEKRTNSAARKVCAENAASHTVIIKRAIVLLLVLVVASFLLHGHSSSDPRSLRKHASSPDFQCNQYAPILPNSSIQVLQTYEKLNGDIYRQQSAHFLTNAVKIPSVSYDDMGT